MPPKTKIIDSPVKGRGRKIHKDALTHLETLDTVTLNVPVKHVFTRTNTRIYTSVFKKKMNLKASFPKDWKALFTQFNFSSIKDK